MTQLIIPVYITRRKNKISGTETKSRVIEFIINKMHVTPITDILTSRIQTAPHFRSS